MGLAPESGFGLASLNECFICVVTRILERLVLEDRACDLGASESSGYR